MNLSKGNLLLSQILPIMNRFFTTLSSLLLFQFAILAQVPGTVDPSFTTQLGANNWVYTTSVSPSGNILIGGTFAAYNNENRSRLAVLTPFGTVDPSYNIGTGVNGTVWASAAATNGKFYVGGEFTTYKGSAATRIFRMNPNGSKDNSFNVGANNTVFHIIVLPDNKLLVAGEFTTFNNQNKRYLVKLHGNGQIDTSFKASDKLNGRVRKLDVYSDGRILIGGEFTMYGNQQRSKIARLLADGSLDSSFSIGTGSSHEIRAFAVQSDGKVVLGGYALNYNGRDVNRLFRVLENGQFDNSFFVPSQTLGPIYDIKQQANGKLLVAGAFLRYGIGNSAYLVRLNSNGIVDSTFASGGGANNGVEYITLSPYDEKVLISGNFTSFGGASRGRVARLFGDSILPSNGNVNVIEGKVFRNLDNNCSQNSGENAVKQRVIKATPGPFWGITSSTGQFSIKTDSGSFEVSQVITGLETLLERQYCPSNNESATVNFGNVLGDTIADVDFANNIQDCALLEVQVSANRRRRCFRNTTILEVQNNGTSPAFGVTAYLQFPRYLNFISASVPHSFDATDSTYRFTIDSLYPGQQKTYYIVDSVSCVPGIMNLELCTKAWVTPTNLCQLDNQNWDGVDLEVTGTCVDESPEFLIRNKGITMTSPRPYQIFYDSLLAFEGTISLANDQTFQFRIPDPEPGATYRVEIQQSDFHPTETFAAATVNCMMQTIGQPGFANPDENPFIAVHCSPVLDSYDPNDKAVFPRGTMPGGKVLPNRMFDYRIRFQNTGNDTAYKVVIIDTLDLNLDMATFTPGPSSHRYELTISGKERPVLTWTFNNIMLPDSFTNSLGSNGFVDFKIKPIANTPLGTKIENLADIYFDFNEPIRTNTTVNTLHIPTRVPGIIDTVRVITGSRENIQKLAARIHPNPAKSQVNVLANENVAVEILNLAGQSLISVSERKKRHNILVKTLEKGIYLLVTTSENGKKVTKLLIE